MSCRHFPHYTAAYSFEGGLRRRYIAQTKATEKNATSRSPTGFDVPEKCTYVISPRDAKKRRCRTKKIERGRGGGGCLISASVPGAQRTHMLAKSHRCCSFPPFQTDILKFSGVLGNSAAAAPSSFQAFDFSFVLELDIRYSPLFFFLLSYTSSLTRPRGNARLISEIEFKCKLQCFVLRLFSFHFLLTSFSLSLSLPSFCSALSAIGYRFILLFTLFRVSY